MCVAQCPGWVAQCLWVCCAMYQVCYAMSYVAWLTFMVCCTMSYNIHGSKCNWKIPWDFNNWGSPVIHKWCLMWEIPSDISDWGSPCEYSWDVSSATSPVQAMTRWLIASWSGENCFHKMCFHKMCWRRRTSTKLKRPPSGRGLIRQNLIKATLEH